MTSYHWHRFSVAEAFERIQQGENPWVAFGDFLDDWHRSQPEDRSALVQQAPGEARTEDEQRWAALFAATVEMLCTKEQLPIPGWVTSPRYYLQEPWYPEARTANLRRLQEETTPETFKRHNVFSGDRILERV
ncbi:MAG TPA: hypothetical protein VFA41_13235 [Ktedonobacteraceae bacterium]|jgi:hypothetical protein|nr:hypothetical protein [Ktedonobacteraceae bacterium]